MAKFNKGDVSEGILAAAITARFISKTKIITHDDVYRVIDKLKKPTGTGSKGLTTITEFDSPNDNERIIDTVICKVNLAEVNMNAFLDRSIYTSGDMRSFVTAAIEYANGVYVRKWADMMYENNQKNVIEVNAEGLLDQTGTKVDLKVVIDGEQKGVGVSLKAGDVKQFGQVGGSKFGSMKELWNPLGVTFTKTFENEYEDFLANKQVAPALTTAYQHAFDKMSKMTQAKLRKVISDFVVHHATRGEKDVVLVQLNKSEAKVYDFEVLSESLADKKITIDLSSGSTTKLQQGGFKGKGSMPKNRIPRIDFKIDNKIFLTIRLKLEGNRISSSGKRLPLVVRSYVEKGPGMTKLLME